MKGRATNWETQRTAGVSTHWHSPAIQPSHLYLVSPHELQELRAWLQRGMLPPDFSRKLAKLSEGGLGNSFVARHSRTIAELLVAAHEGAFREMTHGQRDHLLRVLAYVRKEDDAIPDYHPAGFSDDQQEVHLALQELLPLLEKFKAWRLRTQVAALWRE